MPGLWPPTCQKNLGGPNEDLQHGIQRVATMAATFAEVLLLAQGEQEPFRARNRGQVPGQGLHSGLGSVGDPIPMKAQEN
eukprot:6331000-Lingulodinium_polyedra.AAC.1